MARTSPSGDAAPFENGQRVQFKLNGGRTGAGTVVTASRPHERGYPTQTPPTALDDWQLLVQPEDGGDSVVVLARNCEAL